MKEGGFPVGVVLEVQFLRRVVVRVVGAALENRPRAKPECYAVAQMQAARDIRACREHNGPPAFLGACVYSPLEGRRVQCLAVAHGAESTHIVQSLCIHQIDFSPLAVNLFSPNGPYRKALPPRLQDAGARRSGNYVQPEEHPPHF